MKGTRKEARGEGGESWIEQMSPFEGPEGTTFVFSRGEELWYVLGMEGSEARVSARDLRSFVSRCLAARRSD
jgi:hypothetical protein